MTERLAEIEWSESTRPILEPMEIARMFKRGRTIAQISEYYQLRTEEVESLLRSLLIVPSARYF